MLPAEPEIVSARKAFPDAQVELAGVPRPGTRTVAYVQCGWYGTRISDERGSFAVVSPTGAHADLIGEIVHIMYGDKSVYAYVAETASVVQDISITRRLFAALELLSVGVIPVHYEIVG